MRLQSRFCQKVPVRSDRTRNRTGALLALLGANSYERGVLVPSSKASPVRSILAPFVAMPFVPSEWGRGLEESAPSLPSS